MRSPFRTAPWLAGLAAGLLLGLAGDARATGVVTFDQAPTGDGFTHGLGISLAEAQAAMDAGVPLFRAVDGQLFSVVDDADPASSPLIIETPEEPESFQLVDRDTPASAVQVWDVTNNTGAVQPESLVLVFQRPMPGSVDVDGVVEPFEYDLLEVSLDLQNGSDWIVLQVDDAGETWYYPAVRLGGLEVGEALLGAFETDVTVQNPEIFIRTDEEFVLGLPDWQVRAAFIVPEPSTGLLVALGCAALTRGRPRRS